MSTHHDGQSPAVVLAVDRLTKSFGGIEAVRDVSFAVTAGEIVAMIGPNGAGKTTCFNLVNGQLAPDAGTVTLLGRRIDRLPPRAIARAGVGRTFQVAATFASMTVRENVQMALIAHDRVIVLDRGRIIAEGTPDAIRADPRVRAVYLGEE